MAIVVKLTGGPGGRARKYPWGPDKGLISKEELKEKLRCINPNIEFIKYGRAKADWIVYPDHAPGPSETSLLTKKPKGTRIANISKFVKILQKASATSKKKTSKKKASTRKKAVSKKKASSRKKMNVSDDDWVEEGCDYENCEQCNPAVIKRNESARELFDTVKKINAKQMLASLLQDSKNGYEMRVTARCYYFRSKCSEDGYTVGKECSLVFQKMKSRHGVLKDKQNTVFIYHNGTLKFSDTETYPRLCPYFNGAGMKSSGELDTEATKHIKILLSDGHGLIVSNEELKKHLHT